MTFVFNSRYVLLTYSQCGDLDPFGVMDHISTLGAECIVGRESHADGGLHLHVFCDFGRKFRSRDAALFDVGGHHPNVVPSRGTPGKGFDYAIKDGDVVCGGLGRPQGSDAVEHGGVRTGSSQAKWATITGAESVEEFWRLLHELDPKAAACSFPSLTKYCDWKFRPDPAVYEHPADIAFIQGDLDGRDEWLAQSGIGTRGYRVGGELLAPLSPRRCSGSRCSPAAPLHGSHSIYP